MPTYRILLTAVVLVGLPIPGGQAADAAAPPDNADVPAPSSPIGSAGPHEPDHETAREEVLRWLDQYLAREVLFRKQDIETLQAKIAKMSPDELTSWLEETKVLRAKLDSDRWQSTRTWLEVYLPTKLYSDDEIDQFRSDVAELSPGELLQLLKKIEQKHDALQAVYQSQFERSVRARQAQSTAQLQAQARMNWQKSYLKQQDAAKRAAAQRSRSRSTRPLYGQTQAYASRRSQSTKRYNQPLITSRDAARISVTRSLYGGFRRGW